MANKPLSRAAKKYKDEDENSSPSTSKKPAVKPSEKAKATVAAGTKVEKTATPPQTTIATPQTTTPAPQTPVAAPQEVVAPVVETVAVKAKRPRFVRPKKEKQPQVNAASLPPRSTKATAKIMSKKLVLPPKEDLNFGTKPKP